MLQQASHKVPVVEQAVIGWRALELIQVLDCLTQETIECTAELVAKHTCLGRSVVYNRAQGLSIADQIVVLHDLSSRYCRRAHLYVGLSRVTDGKSIRIAR